MQTIGRPLKSAVPAKGRRVVSGRRDTFTGYVPSTKEGNDYRLIAYESILERDYIQFLEVDDDIVSYRDRDQAFRWFGANGRPRIYRPDFTLVTKSGWRICVEVKPYARMMRNGLIDHYDLIGDQMRSLHGFHEFRVVTDKVIRQPVALYNAELRNSARLLRRRRLGPDFEVRQAMFENGDRTLGELRTASGLGKKAFWTILAVVSDGSIRTTDEALPIEDASRLEWREPT